MQTPMKTAQTLLAKLAQRLTFWKERADRWDRVYLCSMAPMSAEFVRDYEEAQRHHSQW